jgi:hypothetical protein
LPKRRAYCWEATAPRLKMIACSAEALALGADRHGHLVDRVKLVRGSGHRDDPVVGLVRAD